MANSKLAKWKWGGKTDHFNERDHKIDTITIHHMAGDLTLDGCCTSVQGRGGSCNYCIDSDGNIGVMIDEELRSWCSDNRPNDMRSVTIEVANCTAEPDWKISANAMAALIDLCADICERNGIPKIDYTGNKSGNLTMHKWFAATGCPGPYLESKFPYIAAEVNKNLEKGAVFSQKKAETKSETVGTTYLTYDEFEKKYLGKAVDYDGVAGIQCVDLFDQYIKECYGIAGVWCDGAKEFYNKFDSYPALKKTFDRIPNTPELVVKKGDVVIWGNGTWGHVGIGTGEGNVDWFKSLEENTLGYHESTQIVKHDFSGVLGVLRPKSEAVKQSKTTVKKSAFTEYRVQVTVSALNIRSSAGLDAKIKGCIRDKGVYTIMKEKKVGGQTWGKLKSGAGWICLTEFTKRI